MAGQQDRNERQGAGMRLLGADMMENERRTTSEVMQHFGISRTTLYRWVQRGWIAAPIQFGRSVFWYQSSIERAERDFLARSESGLPRARAR